MVEQGLTMGGNTDTIPMDTLDNTTGFKIVAPGDTDYEISGSYIIVSGAAGQTALRKAFGSTAKTIKVQWAEEKKTGLPMYTALCVVTAGVTTHSDPLKRSFTLKPTEAPVATTQA